MLQASTLATSAKLDGDGSVKVAIREGSLKRPSPTILKAFDRCTYTPCVILSNLQI